MYTTTFIQEKFGLKSNTLHYYIKAGAIVPDIDPGRGTGTKRLLSEINVMECVILKNLLSISLPKAVIVYFFKTIRKPYWERSLLDPSKIVSEKANLTLYFYTAGPEGEITYGIYKGPLDNKLFGENIFVTIVVDLTAIAKQVLKYL
jgi:hypothetical protein